MIGAGAPAGVPEVAGLLRADAGRAGRGAGRASR